MRINAVNIFLHRTQFNYTYMPYRYSFQANKDVFIKSNDKNPESVNPSRKVFDTLPQNKLTCACCGRVMIPPSEIEDLRKNHTLDCSAMEAIGVLQKYENNLHAVEKEIFQIFKKETKQNPNLNFKEILNKLKVPAEIKLTQTQFGIFTLIEKASENIDEEKKKQIKELIETEKVKIKNGNNEFRRKHFVVKFEQIFADAEDSETKEHLIRLAKKLPTAYDDKNAFIVKYASRSPEEIGIRLLSYSMRTIEHVKPKNKNGENHIFNYIPECMRCNSFRQDRPMIQQLEEYPEMFANSQKLMDTMVDFANHGRISKWYIIKIQEKLFDESDHVLKLDISRLNMTPKMKKDYIKLMEREEKEYLKASETRAKKTKKELKREQIKINRANKLKNKKSETNRK